MKVLLITTTQARHDMDRLTMWPAPVGLISVTAHCNVVCHPLQALDMTFSGNACLGHHRVYAATACSTWAIAA